MIEPQVARSASRSGFARAGSKDRSSPTRASSWTAGRCSTRRSAGGSPIGSRSSQAGAPRRGPTHGGRRYDENLLLGADLVALTARHFRLAFGAELQTSIWRHGAGIPDSRIAFAFDVDLATRTELMLHLRFELMGD